MNQNLYQHYNYFTRNVKNNEFINPYEAWLLGNSEKGTYIPFKNYEIKPVKSTSPKENLLYQIQMYSFMLTDLSLYLDLNPQDVSALALFEKYQMELNKLKQEYNNRFSPLCKSSEKVAQNTWLWEENWPWMEDNN